MIAGLNRAYEVEENRPWWRIIVIAFWTDDFVGSHGPDHAGCNAVCQLGGEYYGRASWGACSVPLSLAHDPVAANRHTRSLLVCLALSLWAKPKGSKMAMECTGGCSSNHTVGHFHAVASSL
jgi:hypothetical protein